MKKPKLVGLVVLASIILASIMIIGFFSSTVRAVGSLDHFTFTAVPSPAPYNTAFSITITAKDASEQTVTTYTGSNTLSISSGTVSPTSGLAFSSGVCTRTVTITGSPSLTVTLTTTGGSPTKSGTSNSFQVLDVFAIGTIASQTNGQAFSITITAKDHSSRTVTDYVGTNTLSLSSGTISPTTTTGGFSSGVWTGSVTLTGASTGGTVTVSTGGLGRTGTSNTFLMLSKFIYSSIPAGELIAGTSFTIGITAQSYDGATVTSYAGPNTLSDTTGTLSLTTTGSFTNGVWSGSATITKSTASSACKITTIGAGITLQSSGFTVRPAPLDHFTFNTINSPQTVGSGFSITFTAMDMYENQLTAGTNGYSATDNGLTVSTGTITPFSTGGGGWSNGQWTGTVTLHGSAGSSVTISTSGGGKSGTSNSFTVNLGVLDHFTMVGLPSSVVAGTSFGGVTVTAYDVDNNIKTDYGGLVYFTSTDGAVVLPYTSGSKYPFVSGDNGVHTFSGFVLKTVGSQTITVTDVSKSLTSGGITVNPGSLNSFTIGGTPSSKAAGTSFTSVVVKAYDAYNNLKTDYVGSVYFTSSDLIATLPNIASNPYTFTSGDSGSHTFSTNFIFHTVGSQTITATDGTKSITSTATSVTSSSSTPNYKTTISPTSTQAGVVTSYTYTITRQSTSNNLGWVAIQVPAAFTGISVTSVTDSNPPGGTWDYSVSGNIIIINARTSSYVLTGTNHYVQVVFSATAPTSLGSSSPFTSAVFRNYDGTGNQGTLVNTSPSTDPTVTVNPGALDHFTFNTVGTQTAGVAFGITATAQDAYGNTVTGYVGTPGLTYSAGSISPLSMNAFVGGVGTTSVTVTKAGTVVSITATDSGSGKVGIASLTVNHAVAIDHIAVSPASDSVTAGGTKTYTATAFDSYSNSWDVTGSASWSIDVGAGGSWLSNVYTSAKAGTWTVSTGSISGKTGTATLTVNHAVAIDHIAVSPASDSVTAGGTKTYTATAFDSYSNSWDVTGSASWSIDVGAGGSWLSNVYTSAKAGTWTVSTGSISGKTGTATLTVNHAVAIDHIAVSPASDSVTAGGTKTYTATAFDSYSNSWDVTGSASWSIDVGAGGSWLSNVYTSAKAGTWTVSTGSISGKTGTATLTVNHAVAIDHIAVSPASDSVTAGGTKTYTATAFDSYSNSWDVTGSASWSIDVGAGGSWLSNVYTSAKAGTWTVSTGSISGKTGTATLTVNHAVAIDHIAVSPASDSVTAGGTKTYTATAFDSYSNSWDVTGSASWSIDVGAGGSWLSNVYTSAKAGTWTVSTGSISGKTGTASLMVNPSSVATTLTVTCTPDTVDKTSSEHKTTISGTLTYGSSQALSGEPITLYYFAGLEWVQIDPSATITTGSDGSYTHDWTVPTTIENGYYVIEARFAKDDPYQASLADTGDPGNGLNLNVLPEYFFGALAALGACFAGCIIFKKRSSLPHSRGLKVS